MATDSHHGTSHSYTNILRAVCSSNSGIASVLLMAPFGPYQDGTKISALFTMDISGPRFKISVTCCPKWSDSKSVWPRWGLSTWCWYGGWGWLTNRSTKTLPHCHALRGEQLCVYSDPAYPLRPELMYPFREGDYGRPLTPRMIAFNSAMSSLRVSVEWLFGDVTNYFRFIDFKKKLTHWYQCSRQAIYHLCTHEKCPDMSVWE